MSRIHASTHLRIYAVSLLFVGLALARPLYLVAAEPYDPNGAPFAYDPNTIVGTLLGTVTQRAGVDGSIKASYGDPDGDPVTVALRQSPAGMVLTQDPNAHSYALAWRPDAEGVHAVVVSAADAPASGTPATTLGTILWRVLPANRRPWLDRVGDILLGRRD